MPPGAWPLVGRDEELAVARDALTGGSAGIVISGAPGVGKTRLADELLTELSEVPEASDPGSGADPGPGSASASTAGAGSGQTQWPVVRLVATRAAATIPFGATASLLGDTAPVTLPADPAAVTAARQAILERTARDGSGAGARGLVIGIDDAHLLDEASAQLVLHLASAGDARLVVTVRSGHVTPEAVRVLWQEGILRRLELQPLSRDELMLLLTRALGGPIERHSADNLWRVTAGNVLFLRELCRDALERGLLTREHGDVWTWAAAPVLGTRLQELLTTRIGQLGGEVHDAAALLALAEPLPRDLLVELTSTEAVVELDRRGLLETAPDDAVRLVHPLYAEDLRSRLGPLETTDLYARLADGLVARGPVTADDRLRVAVWSVSGGRPVAPGTLADAARAALDRGDAALAERLARAAPGLPATVLVLGEALAALRRHDEAEAVLAPLEHTAGPDLRPAEPGEPGDSGDSGQGGGLTWPTRVAVARLVAHRSPELPLDGAHALTERARALADPLERDLLDATLADTLGYRGHVAEAGERASRVLRSPNPAARAVALGPATAWLVRQGRAEDAVAAARSVLADVLARPDELPAAPTSVVASLGTGLLAAGRLDDLDELCTTAESLSLDQPDRSRGTIALLRGMAALLRGHPGTAKQALGEAVLGFRRASAPGHAAFALAELAEAKALLGEAELARQTWADLPSEMIRKPPLDWRRPEAWVQLVQHGDSELAAHRAIEAADEARDADAPFFELIDAYTALQLGATDQAGRIATLAASVQGPLAEALGQHATALAGGDGTELERAAATFEQLGLRLFAAEAAVHAALAHRRAGSSSRARTASSRAAELQAGCEGVRTPTLAHAAIVADLTERERQIALLAARGLTSRQIGERLDISVRTVDNQLGRVYTKLGVTGRRDLAATIEQLDS